MKFNNRSTQDTRRVLSGKDGAIFSEDGELLASVTQFTASINVSNATFNPLGTPFTHKALLSYEVTLTINETVIETSRFMSDVYEMLNTGVPVVWTFQCAMKGYDGSEERVIFRDCTVDGTLNLQAANVGELWVREWTLAVNSPPELAKLLTYE